MTTLATKTQVNTAIRAINNVYETEVARLIDWSSYGDGYAISIEGPDAIEVQYRHFPLPKGTYLEAINSASVRLYRA